MKGMSGENSTVKPMNETAAHELAEVPADKANQ
jgi:hypothetical protein